MEAVADERTGAPWPARVEARLKALGPEVLSLGSARAQAVIQRAAQGLECLSMPDVLHDMHERVQSSSLPIGQRVRHAPPERMQAQEALARRQGLPPGGQPAPQGKAVVEARPVTGQPWEEAHHPSRGLVATLSLTRPPCCLADSAPQTSAQGASQLQALGESIAAFAQRHQLPARDDAMPKVRKQVPALAALVDFWWQGVHQDLEPCVLSPRWRQWVDTCRRPVVYWDSPIARTRGHRRQAQLPAAWAAVRAAFDQPARTQRLAPHVLAEWHAGALPRTKALPRTASAVAGRNGSWSQMPHHHRGLPRHRDKVWTIVHHVDWRAADGTTLAARWFRRAFPDLCDTAFSHIEALPQPRRRKLQGALSH